MTQEKMRKVITACVSAATVLLVFLTCFLVYQWITIAVYNNRIDKLEKANAEIAQRNEELGEYADYLETPLGKDWLAFQNGFVNGDK